LKPLVAKISVFIYQKFFTEIIERIVDTKQGDFFMLPVFLLKYALEENSAEICIFPS
jgi:hypothetical protein